MLQDHLLQVCEEVLKVLGGEGKGGGGGGVEAVTHHHTVPSPSDL